MVEMETILKVVEACILPIITYSGEIWEINNNVFKEINTIMDKILKRVLKVPITTPREALYFETSLLDAESIIKKNRISMEHRILTGNNQTLKQIIRIKEKNSWAEQNKKLKMDLGIEESDLLESKYHIKNVIRKKTKEHQMKKLMTTAENK